MAANGHATTPGAGWAAPKYEVQVKSERFKFNAAHFVAFPGYRERLHGHNYRVYVELDGNLDPHGLVLDFQEVKPVVRQLCDELDEHWLVPGEHPELRHGERSDGVVEVRYRERYYAAPSDDVLVLPVNNTSAENLSAWFGRQLMGRLEARFPDVSIRRLRVAVEETAGQRGVYHFSSDDRAE